MTEIQLQLKEPLIEEKCVQRSPDDIPTQSAQSIVYTENRKRVCVSIKKFVLVISLNIIFIIMQIVGGYITNSQALIGDGMHEFADCTGYVLSLISLIISLRRANKKYTFGFQRFEVLGGAMAVLVMWIMVVLMVIEAIDRLKNLDGFEVEGDVMFGFACAAVIFNTAFACIFGHHHHGGGGHEHGHEHGKEHGKEHHHEHNDKNEGPHDHEAHQHEEEHHHDKEHHDQEQNGDPENQKPFIVSIEEEIVLKPENTDGKAKTDAPKEETKNKVKEHSVDLNAAAGQLAASMDVLQSFGIVISSVAIWIEPKAKWLDPCCSLFFAATVLFASLRNIHMVLMVLMETVPKGLNIDEIKRDLLKIEGVESVHDIHIWSLTDGVPCSTVHLGVDPNASVCRIIDEAYQYLTDSGITHCTIQCEHMTHMLYCAHECS